MAKNDDKEEHFQPPIIKTGRSGINKSQQISYKNCLLVVGLTLIFSLITLCIASYNIQLNHNLDKRITAQNMRMTILINQVKLRINALENKLASQDDSAQQITTTLQNKVEAVTRQLKATHNQHLYQNQDWLLLKARYYLELAQINAHWSDNFNAAIALLQQADTVLKQVNAPQILELRQTIAKEINQLKTTPNTDIAGLLSQLDAAQISISNLTIQSTISESSPPENTENLKKSNPSAWRAKLEDSVNLLEKLVVVRRNDEEVKPLMSPLFESILRESIRLNLQEAQWAVLNNNAVVYQLSLKQAVMNLKRTFDEQSPPVLVLLKQLNELQQVKLTQEKPTIGLALPLLNQMIDHTQLLNQGDEEKIP